MIMSILNWIFIICVIFAIGGASFLIAQIPFVKRWLMNGYDDK